MLFSIIVVCLNPGEKLGVTLESIRRQTFAEYEVILKDGGSTDGSVERWRQTTAKEGFFVRFFQEKDAGIYDAMNQAAAKARGEFLLFLNCGDALAEETVLERTAKMIAEQREAGADMDRLVLYGDTLGEKRGVTIAAAPRISGFACYRNIPCHQSCFYGRALCLEKPYDLQYQIRADYDHFLWCFYRGGARFVHMGFPVASYEGGGYSERKENRSLDRREHRQITRQYMGKGKLFCYQAAMVCTLAPLRRYLAESRVFSGAYHWLKERAYGRRCLVLAAALLFVLEMALRVQSFV